jgi:hypothetical protein
MSDLFIITGHPKSGKTHHFIKARADVIKKKSDVIFIQSPFDTSSLLIDDGRTYDRLLEMIFWYRDQLILFAGKKIFMDDHPRLMIYESLSVFYNHGMITREQELNLDMLINDDPIFDVWGAKIFMLPCNFDGIRNDARFIFSTTSSFIATSDVAIRGAKIPNTSIIHLKQKKVIKI